MAGLVAPETANNAASSGAMIPLLTLGIPGSASTAVLLAAFMLWGLRPGPLFMEQNPELAWGLIASMYLGNVVLLAISIFAIPLFVQIIKVPYRILGPCIVVICALGTFTVHASFVEMYLMFAARDRGLLHAAATASRPQPSAGAGSSGALCREELPQCMTSRGGRSGIFYRAAAHASGYHRGDHRAGLHCAPLWGGSALRRARRKRLGARP